jgi:hypothetical protein
LVLADIQDSESVSECGVFWHVVATSNCAKVELEHLPESSTICFGPAFLQLLEASSGLELLEFHGFTFKEAHCRALATLKRTGLEVTFRRCSFHPQGAESNFIEWLRRSQVVTKLEFCRMKDSVISALIGNSSVKRLSLIYERDGENTRSLARALPGNQGIECLHVKANSDEMFSLLLRSLWTHPRIQSVEIECYSAYRLSAGLKTTMMNAILRMVQCNTVVRIIDFINLNDAEASEDKQFFQNFVLPRLEMNRTFFEDQRQTLTRADPSIRGQLLGRALHVVRYNPDLLFRFLSENVPVFVRSNEDEDGPIVPIGKKRKARP